MKHYQTNKKEQCMIDLVQIGPQGGFGGNPGGGGYYSYTSSGFDGFDIDLDDIVSSIFGGGRRRKERASNRTSKRSRLKI